MLLDVPDPCVACPDAACAERMRALRAELQRVTEAALLAEDTIKRMAGSMAATDERLRKALGHYLK